MHRHAVGDGRAPRGIGTGVEGRASRRRPAACPRRRSRTWPRCARDGAWSRPPCSRAACRRRRTGRPSFQAASAISGWTERSSLPPKPPPQAVGTMRTRLGPEPHHARDLVAVHVGRLGRDVRSRCGRRPGRPSRPRARYRRARRSAVSNTPSATAAQLGEGLGDVAALHAAVEQQVARLVRLHQGRAGRQSRHRCRARGGSGIQVIGTSSSRMASTACARRRPGPRPPRRDSAPWPSASTGWSLIVGIDAEAVRTARRPPSARAAETLRATARGRRARSAPAHAASARPGSTAHRRGSASAPNRSRPVTLATPSTRGEARADRATGRRAARRAARRIAPSPRRRSCRSRCSGRARRPAPSSISPRLGC